MRCLLLFSVVFLTAYAANEHEMKVIYYRMLKACEDIVADKIAKDEAVSRVESATDGFPVTADDMKQLKPAKELLKGIVANLGLMEVEVRSNFKGLCEKSKIVH